MGPRHTGALAMMAQQHEVVHVIYCQSLSASREEGLRGCVVTFSTKVG